VIAVLDIGVDPTHPDIAANRWTNPNEIPNNAQDDDGNGYVDDTRGWDFTGNGDPNPTDSGNRTDSGHGTHVAGIAAGVTNNNTGIAGVCPGCKVLHLKFGLGLGQELKAIDYIIKTIEANPGLKIPILNVSFGSWEWSAMERDAFAKLGNKGVLTVAAAGNAGLDNDTFDAVDYQGDGIPDDISPLYPASYELPGILSVAASNSQDRLAFSSGCVRRGTPRWRCRFSNWGRASVDVAAPGTDIRSAYLRAGPSSDYRTWNGTSMAAPVVSGIAGLVKSHHPGYSMLQLKNAIIRSVDRPDSLKKLWHRPGKASSGSFIRSNGRVNALSALSTPTSDSYPIHDGMMAGAIQMWSVKRGKVSWPGDVNDIYYKNLVKGRRYAAILRGNHPSRNIDLAVYKPGTKDVWQYENACSAPPGTGGCHAIQPFNGLSPSGRERIEFVASHDGPHYFLASAFYADDGYRLEVRRVAK
jgi:subtilisin family serine protease